MRIIVVLADAAVDSLLSGGQRELVPAPAPVFSWPAPGCCSGSSRSALCAFVEAMAIFFTSDTHFGHGGALGLYRRPFASVPAMNEAIVTRWNETVGPGDDIWHLGDFAIRQSAAVVAELLSRLNGTKHLLIGNNDPPATTEQPGWVSVEAYAEMTVDGIFVVLCHYPFRSWRDMAKGAINLHGHCHGRLKPQPRQFDVGIDVWNFRPVTIHQVLMRNPRARQLA